jgi:hypothetical protein
VPLLSTSNKQQAGKCPACLKIRQLEHLQGKAAALKP